MERAWDFVFFVFVVVSYVKKNNVHGMEFRLWLLNASGVQLVFMGVSHRLGGSIVNCRSDLVWLSLAKYDPQTDGSAFLPMFIRCFLRSPTSPQPTPSEELFLEVGFMRLSGRRRTGWIIDWRAAR